jgi:hypothetical protein
MESVSPLNVAAEIATVAGVIGTFIGWLLGRYVKFHELAGTFTIPYTTDREHDHRYARRFRRPPNLNLTIAPEGGWIDYQIIQQRTDGFRIRTTSSEPPRGDGTSQIRFQYVARGKFAWTW